VHLTEKELEMEMQLLSDAKVRLQSLFLRNGGAEYAVIAKLETRKFLRLSR